MLLTSNNSRIFGAADRSYPSRRYTSGVVGILMIFSFLALIDRMIPNFLVGPIRGSMAISDTQMSLIQGSSFAVSFAIMGLPLGWLVDRVNRRNIIFAGVVLWSLMTIYCGYAESFWQLLLGRIGVGIGEATLAPGVYSLIADYVEPKRRGKTQSIYFLASNVGAGLALIVIGFLVSIAPRMARSLPLISALQPWQIAFVFAGLPGLVLAPVIFAIREVPRRANNGQLIALSAHAATLSEFFRHVAINRRLFVCMYGSLALLQFCNIACYSWAPTLFIRKFGMPADQVGLWLGLTIGTAGLIGGLISVFITDQLAARSVWGGRYFLAALAPAIIAPLHFMWPLLNNPAFAFLCLGGAGLVTALTYASASAIIQDIVSNRMRGKAIAVYMLSNGIIGYALGPSAVALMTDHVYGDDQKLPYAIATTVPPAAIIAAVLALTTLTAYSRLRNHLQQTAE